MLTWIHAALCASSWLARKRPLQPHGQARASSRIGSAIAGAMSAEGAHGRLPAALEESGTAAVVASSCRRPCSSRNCSVMSALGWQSRRWAFCRAWRDSSLGMQKHVSPRTTSLRKPTAASNSRVRGVRSCDIFGLLCPSLRHPSSVGCSMMLDMILIRFCLASWSSSSCAVSDMSLMATSSIFFAIILASFSLRSSRIACSYSGSARDTSLSLRCMLAAEMMYVARAGHDCIAWRNRPSAVRISPF
mmetsp:Transcript_20450/g.52030  ORF Transcript_20450/g.52030 Transcript_20450/m.52030 type:complete len:247 (-) Transcript_20450:52-792(-)